MTMEFFQQYAPVLSFGDWQYNKSASYGQIHYIGNLPKPSLGEYVGNARLLIVVRPSSFEYFVDVVVVQDYGEVGQSSVSKSWVSFGFDDKDNMPPEERWSEAINLSKILFERSVQKYKDWSEKIFEENHE